MKETYNVKYRIFGYRGIQQMNLETIVSDGSVGGQEQTIRNQAKGKIDRVIIPSLINKGQLISNQGYEIIKIKFLQQTTFTPTTIGGLTNPKPRPIKTRGFRRRFSSVEGEESLTDLD